MKLLEVENLQISFDSGRQEAVVVDDISFSIGKGKTVALIGESGSGKSVTSQAILGLLPENGRITGGSINFHSENLVAMSEKELQQIRGKRISMIFQDASVSLNPTMKIGKQVTEGLRFHRRINRNERKREALRLLMLVGFENPSEIYHRYPGELSGGMKQRALIALAISCNPELIIADEPTTALDVTIQKQILDLMEDYKKRTNTSFLLITHDFGLVAEYADRVLVMFNGRIVEEADVYTLFENPLHPYTKGLMASIPRIDSPKETLLTVKDAEKSGHSYEGMRFAPESLTKKQGSDLEASDLVEVEPGHWVRFYTERQEVAYEK
ncbi:ABC transporter ATP-binding protein [Thalassobacillus hwangdonensis]|uniref:ABC transporter ATP-binding protein n=1 Tax=Thalassobacillus hwangdonensis TaxID=546108 RepID=A0ABW3L395_9BACI